MSRNAIYNWEELLKEYLASEYVTKTDFAKAKGINPSLLRRNTTAGPNKKFIFRCNFGRVGRGNFPLSLSQNRT